MTWVLCCTLGSEWGSILAYYVFRNLLTPGRHGARVARMAMRTFFGTRRRRFGRVCCRRAGHDRRCSPAVHRSRPARRLCAAGAAEPLRGARPPRGGPEGARRSGSSTAADPGCVAPQVSRAARVIQFPLQTVACLKQACHSPPSCLHAEQQLQAATRAVDRWPYVWCRCMPGSGWTCQARLPRTAHSSQGPASTERPSLRGRCAPALQAPVAGPALAAGASQLACMCVAATCGLRA